MTWPDLSNNHRRHCSNSFLNNHSFVFFRMLFLNSDCYFILSKKQRLQSGRCIDAMHKWRQFKYSFVYIQISPTSLILGNIFFWKFNSRTRLVGNFIVDRRLFKSPPFMHRVYYPSINITLHKLCPQMVSYILYTRKKRTCNTVFWDHLDRWLQS